jgi:hypothetical protein
MKEEWIETLLSGKLEIEVPSFQLSQKGREPLRGSGRVSWDGGRALRVQASTDGAEAVMGQFGREWTAPGTLIPHSVFVTASGKTQDGCQIEMAPVVLDGFRIHNDSPTVVWDYPTPSLTLSREVNDSEETRRIHALLGPSPEHWPRVTETTITNDCFGMRRLTSSDCLLSEAVLGRIAARRRSDRWFEVLIAPAKTADLDAANILFAVSRGFSFVLGRRVLPLGYVEYAEHRVRRRIQLYNREPTKGSVLPPLGPGIEGLWGLERLVGNSADFFMSDVGQRVAEHFALCWDAADNSLPTQLALAGICLEGLLGIASPDRKCPDPGFTPSDRLMTEQWLSDCGPAGGPRFPELSPRFIKRIEGFLNSLQHLRPVDILRDWERRGVLGVTNDDIVAWQRTRNAAAHARLAGPVEDRIELQDRLSRYHRVLNLILKQASAEAIRA